MTNDKVLRFARTLQNDLENDLEVEEDLSETLQAEIDMMEDLIENEESVIQLKQDEEGDVNRVQEILEDAADRASEQIEITESGESSGENLVGIAGQILSEIEKARALSDGIESDNEFEIREEKQDSEVLVAEKDQIKKARQEINEFKEKNNLNRLSEMEKSLKARVEQTGDSKLADILSKVRDEGQSVRQILADVEQYEETLEELEQKAEDLESEKVSIDTEEKENLNKEIEEVESLRSELRSLESVMDKNDIPTQVRDNTESEIREAKSTLQQIESDLAEAKGLKSDELTTESEAASG